MAIAMACGTYVIMVIYYVKDGHQLRMIPCLSGSKTSHNLQPSPTLFNELPTQVTEEALVKKIAHLKILKDSLFFEFDNIFEKTTKEGICKGNHNTYECLHILHDMFLQSGGKIHVLNK